MCMSSGRASRGWTQPDLQCVFTPGSYAEGKVYVLDDYPRRDRRRLAAPAGEHTAGCAPAAPMSSRIRRSIRTTCRTRWTSASISAACGCCGGCWARRNSASTWTTRRCPGRMCRPTTSCWTSPAKNGSTTYHLIGTARMGPATDPERGGGRPAAGAWHAGAARGRCLDHAEHAFGQYLCDHADDRGEGGGFPAGSRELRGVQAGAAHDPGHYLGLHLCGLQPMRVNCPWGPIDSSQNSSGQAHHPYQR